MPRKRQPGETHPPALHPHWPATGEPVHLPLLEKEQPPIPQSGLFQVLADIHRRKDFPATDWRGGFPTAPSPTQYPDRLHHAPKKAARGNPSPRSSPPLAGDRRASSPTPSRKGATPHPPIRPFPGSRGYPPERRLSRGRLEGRFSYRPESHAVPRPPAPCPEKGSQGKPLTPLPPLASDRRASSPTPSRKGEIPHLSIRLFPGSRGYTRRTSESAEDGGSTGPNSLSAISCPTPRSFG